MLTLAQTARETRMILKYGAIGLGALVVLVFTIRIGVAIFNKIFPAKPVAPNLKYGELPALNFKSNTISPTYTINTVSSTLPILPDKINIYKVKENETNLFTIENVRQKLSNATFTQNEKKIDEIVYQWSSSDTLNKTITYNIVNGDFDISSRFLLGSSPPAATNLPRDKEGITYALEFLKSISEDTSDIDPDASTFKYYRLKNFTLDPVDSYSNAEFVKIALIQKPINDIPIVYKSSNASDMRFIITGGERVGIVEAFYKHRFILRDDFGTYPLKTSEEAFKDLQTGNALILLTPKNSTVEIRNVYLAYYMGIEVTSYILPVVVFEGVDFKAYVPAISKLWILSPEYKKLHEKKS